MSGARKIYEKYVKSLSSDEREQLLELLKQDVDSSESKTATLASLEGLGASLWADTNADDYVDSLRDDWEAET